MREKGVILTVVVFMVSIFMISCAPAKSTVAVNLNASKTMSVLIENGESRKIPSLPAMYEFEEGRSYKLMFEVQGEGGVERLYGMLQVFHATEYTKFSKVEIKITDEVVEKALYAGEIQIINIHDPSALEKSKQDIEYKYSMKVKEEKFNLDNDKDKKAHDALMLQKERELKKVEDASKILTLTLGNRPL